MVSTRKTKLYIFKFPFIRVPSYKQLQSHSLNPAFFSLPTGNFRTSDYNYLKYCFTLYQLGTFLQTVIITLLKHFSLAGNILTGFITSFLKHYIFIAPPGILVASYLQLFLNIAFLFTEILHLLFTIRITPYKQI